MQTAFWINEIAAMPNDGNKFAEVVRDLVSMKHKEVAYAYSSNDGGIDVHVPKVGLAFQCKFVRPATAVGDVTKHIERDIDEEFEKIRRHLNPGEATKQLTQFQIWKIVEEVRSYTYVTSLTLPNGKVRAVLKTHIKDHLKRLAKLPGLSHLTKVNVEIWDQQAISCALNEFLAVRAKWFQVNLPPGIEKFTDWQDRKRGKEQDPKKRNFHAYLFSDVLAYQPHPVVNLRPPSVFALLDEGSPTDAVLVYGAGGQGKSRLLAEVANRAVEADWNVFVLSSKVRAEALDQLIKLSTNSPVLLLLDYAEHCGELAEVHTRLKTLNAKLSCRMSLLLASRTTACIDGTEMEDSSVARVEVNSAKADQEILVKKILGRELEEFASKCMFIPVFAAFVRLLFDREQLDSLEELRAENDFHSWIRKHVAGDKTDKLSLAKLCSLLPCSALVMKAAISQDITVRSYADKMLSDGWLVHTVDAGDESWQLAHDLVADGLVIDAFKVAATANHFAAQLLEFASSNDSYVQCVRTLNRVAADPYISKVNWYYMFAAGADRWKEHVYEIARGSLIPKDSLLALMIAKGITIEVLNEQQDLRRILGLIVKDAAYSSRQIGREETLWLRRALELEAAGDAALLISYWLQSDVTSLDAGSTATTWLNNHANERLAGYVYAGWLNSMRPLKAVSGQMTQWLKQYNQLLTAVFPITAWLECLQTKGIKVNSEIDLTDDSSISNVVHRWLEGKFRSKSLAAGRLHRAWINATHDTKTFEYKTIGWLKLHKHQFSAQYVVGALLFRGYSVDALSAYVASWLANPAHIVRLDASYVYYNWLKANGNPALVRDSMLTWLGVKNSVDENWFASNFGHGRRVLTSWLTKVGEVHAVERYTMQWLSYNEQYLEESARHVYVSWLTAGGSHELVKTKLHAWLARPKDDAFIEREQVLSAWLRFAGEDKLEIEKFVRIWCADSQRTTSKNAEFLVANWRRAGGARDVVDASVKQRARLFKLTDEAYFAACPFPSGLVRHFDALTQQIHLADDPSFLLEEVRVKIDTAALIEPKKLDHLLRRWLEKMGRTGVLMLEGEFLKWTSTIENFSLAQYTLPEILSMRDIGQVGQTVEELAITALDTRCFKKYHLYIFRGWIRSGRPIASIDCFLQPWLSTYNWKKDIKSAEVLVSLQDSEFGNEQWVSQAVEMFTSQHGDEALKSRV